VKQSITVTEMVTFLNQVLELDPIAISELFEHGEPCNEAAVDMVVTSAENTIRPLGLINGMFWEDGDTIGAIARVVEDDGTISRFEETRPR